MNYNFQKNNIIDNLKRFIKTQPALFKLIAINVLIWLLVNLLDVLSYLFNGQSFGYSLALKYLAVPSNLHLLSLKPWTAFTYMFLHTGFMHLLFNMLWLYWFGSLFVQFLGKKKLYITYILSGLFGAFFFVAAYNVFPAFHDVKHLATAMGASASVLGIVVVTSFYRPNFQINLMFIGRVKIVYIAIFTLIMDVLLIKDSNPGGHIAHLGGAFFGFIYIMILRSREINFRLLFKNILKTFKNSGKFKYKEVYKNQRVVSDDEYNATRAERQKKIDEILDKISKSGYEKLSKEEKEFLFKSGNQ